MEEPIFTYNGGHFISMEEGTLPRHFISMEERILPRQFEY